jgi:hypothetical protein
MSGIGMSFAFGWFVVVLRLVRLFVLRLFVLRLFVFRLFVSLRLFVPTLFSHR